MWEVATGNQLAIFKGHTNPVTSVGFSPDGKILASGSRDNTIKLWEVIVALGASGKELATLKGHTDLVLTVGFSPDGKTLASGSWDNIIKLWEVSEEYLPQRGCEMVGRNLTPEEWQQYFGEKPYQKTCPQYP